MVYNEKVYLNKSMIIKIVVSKYTFRRSIAIMSKRVVNPLSRLRIIPLRVVSQNI